MFDKFFSYKMMKDFSQYALTGNWESQVLADKAAANPDFKTTGTKMASINGTLVLAMAAQATIDLSASATCNVAGVSYADGTTLWLLTLQKADGTPYVMSCGTAAAPKIPYFDPATYVAIGLTKIVTSGAAYVVGTTNLDAGTVTVTHYQILAPIVPHSDNLDKN